MASVAAAVPAVALSFRRQSRSVLVVDDEPLIQVSLGRLLRRRGYLPLAATTVSGAVRITDESTVWAVVLDLCLRGESGLDFLPWFRAQPQHRTTPIVILTGQTHLTRDDLVIASKYDALVFYKPVAFDLLDHCLRGEGVVTPPATATERQQRSPAAE